MIVREKSGDNFSEFNKDFKEMLKEIGNGSL